MDQDQSGLATALAQQGHNTLEVVVVACWDADPHAVPAGEDQSGYRIGVIGRTDGCRMHGCIRRIPVHVSGGSDAQ
jgi:hypothetical protein